eukprot:6211470-Prymnesium_polylepis.1
MLHRRLAPTWRVFEPPPPTVSNCDLRRSHTSTVRPPNPRSPLNTPSHLLAHPLPISLVAPTRATSSCAPPRPSRGAYPTKPTSCAASAHPPHCRRSPTPEPTAVAPPRATSR